MGRGGVGNTFSPAALSTKGDFTKQTDGTAAPTSPVNISKGHVGRGGVGNYQTGEGARKNAEIVDLQERQRQEEMLRREIEGQVDRGLGRPERVYGSP